MEILFVRKHGTRYIIFLKSPSILTNIISNKDLSKEFTGNINKCKACAHTMAAIEILHKIVMDNSNFSPNQTQQVEEDGTSAPLRLMPSTYTQSSLLKEINKALQELNFPSISQATMSKISNTHFPDVSFSKNTKFSKCRECIMLKAQMKTTTTKELEEKA